MFQLNDALYDQQQRAQNNRQRIIHRAKMKSLRISVAIIAGNINYKYNKFDNSDNSLQLRFTAFIICWTPYYATMLFFMFADADERVSDVRSILRIHIPFIKAFNNFCNFPCQFGDDLMSAIFFFGMSNSVVNPIIYGAFQLWPMRKYKKENSYNNNNNGSSITRQGNFCSYQFLLISIFIGFFFIQRMSN